PRTTRCREISRPPRRSPRYVVARYVVGCMDQIPPRAADALGGAELDLNRSSTVGYPNQSMEYRMLGGSGLEVSVLSFGTMTLGGEGRFAAMGNVQVEEARRLMEICFEAGVNLIDAADAYSGGKSEEVVGQA